MFNHSQVAIIYKLWVSASCILTFWTLEVEHDSGTILMPSKVKIQVCIYNREKEKSFLDFIYFYNLYDFLNPLLNYQPFKKH